ncbi:hypothetical protein [Paenibacillus larvae]|uniref:hypothetical protein n=1 Tax=Paenibacillus larvae TaxID=1464 RepID=UPI00288C6E74|nr:hypothetical protein [Paenibacillus larvae]MDT2191288.1 hypothetical protein [Paenibacillus larvae]MDT2237721.1 hypothetical protein [Paenibacillus larvae]MDT2242850.1 hypothetical protein [Paenibacillus larvae]MDT2249437.1 hypothetical protein [Paenibacillus larvae]MDT2261561.1 hypothetical protein [Paenibacillus larvae]
MKMLISRAITTRKTGGGSRKKPAGKSSGPAQSVEVPKERAGERLLLKGIRGFGSYTVK